MSRILPLTVTLLAGATLPMARPQVPPDDAIRWSASRRLTWEDFKAKPPAGYLHGAQSALSYSYSFGCRSGVLYSDVVALFLPQQSWVARRILSSGLASRVGIEHEQVHFDLAEVFARRVRRRFATLDDPCPRSDEALNQIAEQIFREHADEQRRFETDTRAGEIEATQIQWSVRIARDLAALEQFAVRGPRPD